MLMDWRRRCSSGFAVPAQLLAKRSSELEDRTTVMRPLEVQQGVTSLGGVHLTDARFRYWLGHAGLRAQAAFNIEVITG